MCQYFACICLCTTCMLTALQGQKVPARFPPFRVTDGCELLCAGNQTQALLQNIQVSVVVVCCFLMLNLFSVYGYFACMSVYHMHAVPMKATRGY